MKLMILARIWSQECCYHNCFTGRSDYNINCLLFVLFVQIQMLPILESATAVPRLIIKATCILWSKIVQEIYINTYRKFFKIKNLFCNKRYTVNLFCHLWQKIWKKKQPRSSFALQKNSKVNLDLTMDTVDRQNGLNRKCWLSHDQMVTWTYLV